MAEKTYSLAEVTDLMRGAIEHRATWFYLVSEEARKKGLDPKDFGRKAITACGVFHGNNKFHRTDDLKTFIEEFAASPTKEIFDMDVQMAADGKTCDIYFHYCPLVNAWKKLGATKEDIEMYCDIAMDGDRGITSTYPNFKFTLGDTIAQGHETCHIHFDVV